jgi:hypothetical protein
MNITDKLYTEWAWRTESGIPDINNPEDKRVLDRLISELSEEAKPITKDDIIALLSSVENDTEALQHIKKYISNRPNQSGFFEYIKSKNIDDSTLESGDAAQRVFNVLSNNDQLSDYMQYIKKPLNFDQLGSSGNLVSALQDELTADTVQLLINIGGQEGGRGVGKAEIGLASLVGDVKMMKGGKGDLDWNGKYLEVKGTAARLGKRDHSFTGGAKILDTVEELGLDKSRPDKFMPAIQQQAPDRYKQAVKDLKDLLSQVYDSELVNTYITDESSSDSNTLRVALQKVYAGTYAKREGVDHFIFVDTSKNFGSFMSLSPEQLINYIGENPKSFSNPINLNNGLAPQVFTGGIK